ncbi:hypothetical protein [Paenibacillus sp. A14]
MENHEVDKAREVKELRSRLDAVEQQLAQKTKYNCRERSNLESR